MTKIAINGLGRIGRLVLRHYINDNPRGVEIVAANDLTPIEELAYLIEYDSVHRRATFGVGSDGDSLKLNGKEIKVTSEMDPTKLPWGKLGVDIVLECTGRFRKRDDAAKHIAAGARKVIISAPSESADLTVVMGVNEGLYDNGKHDIISNASCTTNSLAPPVKVLNDAFGIEYLMVTTIHAYTASQALVDKATASLKRTRGRAAAVSLVPTSTGAAKATALVIPELKGKMDAIAVRTPVPDGALTDIVAHLKKDITVDSVNEALKKAADGPMKKIIEFNEDQIVSADILGNSHSAIVDTPSTRVIMDRVVKVLVWYDNEYGYAGRLLDLARHICGK